MNSPHQLFLLLKLKSSNTCQIILLASIVTPVAVIWSNWDSDSNLLSQNRNNMFIESYNLKSVNQILCVVSEHSDTTVVQINLVSIAKIMM